jgi:hypothetical protein
VGALLVLLSLVVAGCLPVPDVRVALDLAPPSYRVAPEKVSVETTWWPAPSAPHSPPEFDRTGVRRTFFEGDAPRIVVVAVPGLLGGAASFDPWARAMVAAQEGLEVWAIDRRANQFEDRSGIARALERQDPEVALHYYFGGPDGPPTFAPVPPRDLSFLAHWGLHVHLRDLHTVVERARATGARVVLAGHSLGAGIASLYGAYRVPPEDGGGVGQDYVDALILLDGTIGRTGAFGRADAGFGLLGFTIIPTVDDLVTGRSSPYLTLGYGPGHFVRHAVVALYAHLDPEGTAPAALSRYPISNRALLGVISDDEYALAPAAGVSVGHAVDAIFSGNVTAFLLMGAQGARSRTVIGPAPGAARVDWSPGDPRREVVDLATFAAARSDPDSDVSEWYFPLRLLLDVAALSPRLDDVAGFVPSTQVDLPTLAIGAGRGLVQSASGFQSYANTRPGASISVTVLESFTHSDLLFARDNPVVPITLRWLRSEIDRAAWRTAAP